MEELIQIINQKDAPFKLIHWLHQHHVEIVLEKDIKISDFVRDLFSIFLYTHPPKYTEKEWEKITMICFMFIVSIFPSPKLIPKLPLVRYYEPLFSVTLLLSSWRNPDEETRKWYIKIFHHAVDYYNKGFGTHRFYSRSPICFYKLIPVILEKEFHTKQFSKEIKFFLQSIPNVKKEDLNYDFINFTSEILMRIKDCEIDPQELVLAFQRIFEFSFVSSSIFLQHFFYIWLYFVKDLTTKNPSMIEVFSGQIDTVTELFLITSSRKHHELHRTFPWHLCFYFYNFVNREDHKEKILSLICNGIRRANRLDSFKLVADNVQRFAINCIKNYSTENSWPMHYLLSSLESTVYCQITNLEPIIGAASMNCTQHDTITMTKVTFAEENSGLSPLDYELYAYYPLRKYETMEDIVPVFNLMTKYCDSFRKHLSSLAIFQLAFAKNIGEMLKEEIKWKKSFIAKNENEDEKRDESGDSNPAIDVQTSVPLQYLVGIVRSWTKLMIVVAHRQNVINTYSQREIATYPGFSPGLQSRLEKVRRLLDFTPLFKRFFNILYECPDEFYPLFAYEIAREMFKAMKKGLITYTFVEYFQNYKQSLFFNILNRMMEIAANNSDLFFSQLASSTNSLYLWIVFTIRFGASSTCDRPNPLLGIILSMYQKLFITAVLFNIKRIVNQSIALRTVTIYLQNVKIHCQTDSESQQENQAIDKSKKKEKKKHKPIFFDEIQDSAKFEALGTMITLFIEEPKFLEIQYLMPFLAATFKIGNKELIMKASEICLKKFTIEKAKKYCASYDSIQKLFTYFFNAMTKIEFNTAKQILKIIPAYAPLYLQTPHLTFSTTKGILIDDLDFEMDLILEAVTTNLSDNPEIISSLFVLITCCFESVLKKLDLPPDSYTRTIKKLIILLCQCWCYDHLHPQIENFTYYLTSAFGDAFIKGDSNAFILCLLDVAGGSRSEMSRIAIDIAKTFFEYLKKQKMNDKAFLMHQTIDQLLMFFPPPTRLFSMLCGFSLMIRFFPANVRLFHIRSFLVQTTDFPPLDFKFPKLVNRFLKEYLLSKPDSEKEPFMQMIYDIICPLSTGIRTVLMKRASKLGLPIPVSSIEEIEECPNQVLMIQKLTLAFLCGLQQPFEMTPSIGAKVMEFVSARGEASSLEKLSRILSLIYSILKNDQVFQYFKLMSGSLSAFLHFLCNSLPSRFPPLNKSAKKCFAILKDKSSNDPNFEQQLQFIYMEPEKYFHFFSPLPERINFYVRLTKIIPNKIPAHVITLFYSAIFEYEAMKDADKMKYLSNFIKILKFLTVKDYIKRQDVSQIILSHCMDGFTHLQRYLKFIAHLYENSEIPFITLTRKYIIRFVVLFPVETIDFLMNTERSLFSYIFIEDLIFHDESNTFLNTFLKIFQNITDYSIYQPALFKLVENLSDHEKYASDPEFLKALQKNFDSLYPIVSNQLIHNENDFTLITYTAKAIINCFKYQFNANKVFGFCKLFLVGYFSYSDVYRNYVNTIFKQSTPEHQNQLLDLIISMIHVMPPLYLDFLLPHTIRNFKGESLLLLKLWELLTEWLQKKEELTFAILHSFVYLLDKTDPPKESVIILLDIMKDTMSSADIRLVIYSLKISTKLSMKKLVPPEVFVAFLKQFFAFQKFSEPPYSKYFFEFLKTAPEMLVYLKNEDYNFLSLYMHHRFLHPQELKNVLSPINSVFLAAPCLLDYLPFSLITAVSTALNNKLNNPPGNKEEIESVFTYAANFCQIAKCSQEELDYFISICFKYLEKLLISGNTESDFFDKFYALLTTSTTNEFPTDMLSKINIIDNSTFGLVCCAAKIKGNELFDNYPNLVELTLNYIENDNNHVNSSLLQCFMTAIFKDQEISSRYSDLVNTTFQNICDKYSPANSERLFIIAREIVKIDNSSSQYMFQMWTFYESLHCKEDDKEPILRFLIRCIEYVPSDLQVSSAQNLLSKIGNNKKKAHVFTTALPYLFQSKNLSNETKKYFVGNLISLLLIDKLCNAEKILAMLYKYSDEAHFDTKPYIIQVLLLRAQRANDSGSLLFIERIISYLPADMKERISYLFFILPIELWEDSFLPLIIALLTPKVKIWQPLFTLSHQFRSIGAEMVAATFSKLLDENNKDQFIQFLTDLLKNHTKTKGKYTQIISGVITMFHSSRMKIPYYLAEKAIKYSGNIYQLEFFLETDSVPTWRYLLPHDANDIIYGMHRPLLTTSQAAAIALTFMNEYEAAKNSYIQQSEDEAETPIFEAMKEINNHFIAMCKNNDIPSLLQPLTTINHTSSVLVLLEEATTSYINGELKDFSILDKVTEANLSTAMGKNYLSAFEKERLTIIQAMVSAISGHPQLNPDISCLNHTFVTLYQKFERLINHQPPKPDVIIEGGNPVCLMMPSMRSQFVHVCGYTTRGMVAVGKQHIEDYLNKISSKITNKEMLPIDWRNFAAFAFNVFCVQPSAEMFSTVYGAYYRLLSQEDLNLPLFIVHEACARIITLCRLAFINNEEESSEWLETIRNSAPTVFSYVNGEHWKFWLQHIVELAKTPWFCDIAFGLFAEMSYRSCLYMMKENEIEKDKEKMRPLNDALQKLISHPSSQINMMNIVEDLFNTIFSISFDEKHIQTTLLNFALECQKIEDDIENSFNIMDERQKVSTNAINSFQRSLRALTENQIKMIGDFPSFVRRVKMMQYEEIVKLIQDITNSKQSIIEIRDIVSKSAQKVNDNLPFIFPVRLEKILEISILQIQDDFTVLNPNMITLQMASSMYSWKHFIVQRSATPGGYHKSLMTLTNTMFLFKLMLQRQYSSRRRKMVIFPFQFFEIGANLILVPLVSNANTIEDYFQMSTMMTSKEWIQKYTVPKNPEEEDDENPNDLVVTEKGRESIKTFPSNFFSITMLEFLTTSNFLKMRPYFANSIILTCLMRHIFNAPYPMLDQSVFCINSAIVPIMHSGFDNGQITDTTPKVSSCFRLSPNIVTVLGTSLDGWCIMTVAVFSKVMIKNIESVRSYIEAMIFDEDQNINRINTIDDVIHTRTEIEERFIDFCPPRVANVESKTAEEWLDGVEKFINRATNPENQPVEAIPWF